MANRVDILIKGDQGSGKTRIFTLIHAALQNEGYSTLELNPNEQHDDRLIAYDPHHEVHMDTIQTRQEMEVANGNS